MFDRINIVLYGDSEWHDWFNDLEGYYSRGVHMYFHTVVSILTNKLSKDMIQGSRLLKILIQGNVTWLLVKNDGIEDMIQGS